MIRSSVVDMVVPLLAAVRSADRETVPGSRAPRADSELGLLDGVEEDVDVGFLAADEPDTATDQVINYRK